MSSVSITLLQEKERAVLPPIQAISSVAAPLAQSDVAAISQALSSLASEPDAAVALSMAVSAGVEGKLNMLLLAARERMVDSLFAVIDVVSAALNTPQEPGETNTAFALRLADGTTDLTPSELGNVQQQVNAQVKTLPLQLIAQALHDPAGAAAAQVVAYLEVSSYKDRDLATKAVVNSYGLNDGNPEAPIAATPLKQASAAISVLAPNTSPSVGAPTGQQIPSDRALLQATVPPAPSENSAASGRMGGVPQQIGVAGQPAPPRQGTEAGRPIDTRPGIVSPIAPEAGLAPPEVSAILFKLDAGPTQPVNSNPTQAAQAFAPRQIQQIEANIQDGLKVVINLVIDTAGPELLQIMAQGEPLANKVLAQALVANMMDSIELQTQPPAIALDSKTPASIPVSMATLQPTLVEEVAQTSALSSRPADAAPAPAPIPLAAAQVQAIVIPVVGVPFAIAQYLPTSVVVDDREDIFVDRVDPVDGEKHGKGHADQQQEEEEGQAEAGGDEPKHEPRDQPVSSSSDVGSLDAAASNRLPASTEGPQLALPRSHALPPLQDHAHELYQRMAGWE
jgi:hypothetical protein